MPPPAWQCFVCLLPATSAEGQSWRTVHGAPPPTPPHGPLSSEELMPVLDCTALCPCTAPPQHTPCTEPPALAVSLRRTWGFMLFQGPQPGWGLEPAVACPHHPGYGFAGALALQSGFPVHTLSCLSTSLHPIKSAYCAGQVFGAASLPTGMSGAHPLGPIE